MIQTLFPLKYPGLSMQESKKLWTYLLLFISTISLGQVTKTFRDSVFKIGDFIKTPSLVYVLDGNGHENDDSLKLISTFINSHKNLSFQICVYSDSRRKMHEAVKLTQVLANDMKEKLVRNFRVDPKQIIATGYGWIKPIIPDSIIKKAPTKQEKEKLHAINRRTELKVIEIK
jgi:hypothetical protein